MEKKTQCASHPQGGLVPVSVPVFSSKGPTRCQGPFTVTLQMRAVVYEVPLGDKKTTPHCPPKKTLHLH